MFVFNKKLYCLINGQFIELLFKKEHKVLLIRLHSNRKYLALEDSNF